MVEDKNMMEGKEKGEGRRFAHVVSEAVKKGKEIVEKAGTFMVAMLFF